MKTDLIYININILCDVFVQSMVIILRGSWGMVVSNTAGVIPALRSRVFGDPSIFRIGLRRYSRNFVCSLYKLSSLISWTGFDQNDLKVL
jgi:hypothetical protein